MEGAKKTRNRAPPEEEWERIKPELTRLLFDEKLTLKETARLLANLHNFHASICMYKPRLRKWGLQKYFKKIELAAAADAVRPFYKSGIAAPRPTIGRREVPLDRMKRHFPESFRSAGPQKHSSGNQLDSSTSSYQRAVDKVVQRCRQMSIPRVTLQVSPGMSFFEETAYQVHAYYSWRLTREDDYEPNLGFTSPSVLYHLAVELTLAFQMGSRHLVQPMLKEFCMMSGAVIVAQHLDLLPILLMICSSATLDQHERLYWDACLKYIHSIANKSLSKKNPFLMLLEVRRHDLSTVIPYTVLSDLTRELALHQRHPSWEYIYLVDQVMVEIIRNEQGHEAAYEFCSDKLNFYRKSLGNDHSICLRWLLTLGRSCLLAGMLSEAKDICRELMGAGASPNSQGPQLGPSAMYMLGVISRSEGNYSEKAFWCRHASVWFERVHGSEDELTQIVLQEANQLEATLQSMAEGNTGAIEQHNAEEARQSAEGLEFAIEQLGEEMSRIDLDTGDDDSRTEGGIWNEDGPSIDDEPTDTHASPLNMSNAIEIAEVEGGFGADHEQHDFTERPSSLETFQSCPMSQGSIQCPPDDGDEPFQNLSSYFSSAESTSCRSNTWTALPLVATSSNPGDNYAGFPQNFQQHETASWEQFVEGTTNPPMNDPYAPNPADYELPVLDDNADFDDPCRMPCFDQQFDITTSATGFDMSHSLDVDTTELATQVSPEAQIQSDELLNFDNVFNDSDWLNNFSLPDIQTDSDLRISTDTTMMEFVEWK